MPYEGKHEKEKIFLEVEYEGPSKPKWSWKIKLLIVFAALLILGAGGLGGIFWYFSKDLPSIETLREYQPSLVTKVYGEDRQLIGQFYIERRVVVPFSRMPPDLLHAIIAVEDSRFYEHKGIDPLGILRALLTNIETLRLRQGASTITQQLARSLFLSSEKSLKRKIKEALLAWKIEKVLTKDEILELYLNQIYFGHGAYGVQSAARTYFGKNVDQLNLSEVAYLAGVPRAPTEYSPYINPERAKQRQGVVLRRMVEEGFITEDQFRRVYRQDLYFQKLEKEEEIAPYFMEYLRQNLSAAYGENMVYKGGLSVYTTLNLTLQKAATPALQEGLREVDKRQGYRGPIAHKSPKELAQDQETGTGIMGMAAVKEGDVIDGVVTAVDEQGATVVAAGRTGRISPEGMAWAKKRLKGPDLLKDVELNSNAKPSDILHVGDVIRVKIRRLDPRGKTAVFSLDQGPVVEGALIALDPRTGAIKAMVGGYDFKRSEFNRALSARRQPGSAFKPIIYATAIERGFTPATIMVDSPVVFVDEEQQKVWRPENYESKFFGPISLREALAHSRNLATVKLLDRVGIKNVVEFAKRVGITSPLTPDLSMALGSSSVSLIELASAFGVFANEGVRVEPIAVLSVADSSGRVLEEHEPVANEVIAKETAYVITNMMEDVIQKGTGWRAKVLGRPLAGKTGTTNDFTDAWFVGFAPNLVAGVWVGFDDVRSLGDREAGASAALPIWIGFMRAAFEVMPEMTFPIPENVVFANIDPQTGLLAPEGAEDAVIEIFVKGTEPTKLSHPQPKPAEFFRIDASNG
ncbi:MAG: PBP1A family penicillin-binding protein [Nitrospirae bacterium]|nr:PBP1A family penicillin-binding protein [Nitrospirota bacterium]